MKSSQKRKKGIILGKTFSILAIEISVSIFFIVLQQTLIGDPHGLKPVDAISKDTVRENA